MRPAFLAAAARPFLRRNSAACSMLASVSVRAFLQSDMPAPVRSRRSLIMAAVISAISKLHLFREKRNQLVLFFGGPGRFRLGTRPVTARRELAHGPVAPRADPDGIRLLLRI